MKGIEMIEIKADGKLYIANYFMPPYLRDDRSVIKLAMVASPIPVYSESETESIPHSSDYKTLEFNKVRNIDGDIRWLFLGEYSDYKYVVDYFLKLRDLIA